MTEADYKELSREAEIDLMTRIANGDRAAFGTVTARYMTEIFRFSYGILGEAAKAEDITQETFLKLWTRAGQWTPTGRVRSWLFRIAHNLCMDDLRGRKPAVDIDKLAYKLPDRQPDQRKRYDDRQVSKVVSDALFALPERQRTALMLVYYSDQTNIDAAKIMGVSVDAIESLLSRGKRTLKDALSGSKTTLLEGYNG